MWIKWQFHQHFTVYYIIAELPKPYNRNHIRAQSKRHIEFLHTLVAYTRVVLRIILYRCKLDVIRAMNIWSASRIIYFCVACSGNTQVVDIYDGNYDVEEDLAAREDGRCELYLGLACAKYVGGRAVFVRSEVQQIDMETRLKGESIDVTQLY